MDGRRQTPGFLASSLRSSLRALFRPHLHTACSSPLGSHPEGTALGSLGWFVPSARWVLRGGGLDEEKDVASGSIDLTEQSVLYPTASAGTHSEDGRGCFHGDSSRGRRMEAAPPRAPRGLPRGPQASAGWAGTGKACTRRQPPRGTASKVAFCSSKFSRRRPCYMQEL